MRGVEVVEACDSFFFYSGAFKCVKEFYGNQCAERSGVPKICHIMEGLVVLKDIGATMNAQQAYCLHPIFQADEDLKKIRDDLFSRFDVQYTPQSVLLAMEYRNQANAWLSDKVTKDILSRDMEGNLMHPDPIVHGRPKAGPLYEVQEMLIADKVQNYKDFLTYHKGTHERSDELEVYFKEWLKALGVSDKEFKYFCDRIEFFKKNSVAYASAVKLAKTAKARSKS